MKFNINKFIYEEDNQKCIHEIKKELEAKQVDVKNIEYGWKMTKEAIMTTANKALGESRHKSKSWYNDEY